MYTKSFLIILSLIYFVQGGTKASSDFETLLDQSREDLKLKRKRTKSGALVNLIAGIWTRTSATWFSQTPTEPKPSPRLRSLATTIRLITRGCGHGRMV